MAVQRCVRFTDLPKIGNGRLIATKEHMPFTGTTSTSLPPLTKYYVTGTLPRRWGEDESIKHLTKSGLSKCGCNFDACHPVSEGPEVRYEGYMYPKALRQDLGEFHAPVIHTGRHVPRTCTCEVFPRNNIYRKSATDSSYVLGETTRRSIEDYFSSLYRTTHYDNIYRDTLRHMTDRMSRDAMYAVEGPNYDEAATCTRVHNHPDPCHHCWTGGYNKDFNLKLAEFQSKLYDVTKNTQPNNEPVKSIPCKCCAKNVNEERPCACVDGNSEEIMQVKDEAVKQCTSCGRFKDSAETEEANSDVNDSKVTDDKSDEETSSTSNTNGQFGPWEENIAQNKDEKLLMRNVYQCKLPSSMHCKANENEFAVNVQDRHRQLNHGGTFLKPWVSLCREKLTQALSGELNNETMEDRIEKKAKEELERSKQARNSWTFRDENNIRKPCIADVLGTFNKSDAHKRYHAEHRETVPDVRDNMIYTKRVQFYGYNSYVFR